MPRTNLDHSSNPYDPTVDTRKITKEQVRAAQDDWGEGISRRRSPDDNAFFVASSLDGCFHDADEPRLPASLEVEEVEEAEEAEEAPPGPAAPAPDEDDDAHAPDDIEDATAPEEIEDEARL